MQRYRPAKLGLRCVSAIAASVLVTCSAFAVAVDGANSCQPDERQLAISTMTVATLHLAMIGRGAAEPDGPVGSIGPLPSGRYSLPSDATIVGIASFYDDPGETASGEQYDPNAFTAAAQLRIRGEFGGIKFGRLYRAAYGVGEYEGKKIILKFNDVGPLKPGRKFDLSRAAMAYFDGLEKGLLPDFKVMPLPLGRTYPAGPITDEQLTALLMGNDETKVASADEKQTPASVAHIPASVATLGAETAPMP
jgi:peptidoglycan lytic transglycosylase